MTGAAANTQQLLRSILQLCLGGNFNRTSRVEECTNSLETRRPWRYVSVEGILRVRILDLV